MCVKIVKKIFQVGIFSVSLYGFILAYQVWLDSGSSFHIYKINISGNDYFSEKELLQMASIDPERSIWDVNLTMAATMIKSHPFIDKVHISRQFPDILTIQVQEKKPVALLNFDNQLFCLDPSGMVLPSNPAKSYHLPVITGKFKGGLKPGSQIQNAWVDEGLHLVQYVLEKHPRLYGQISEVVVGKMDGSIMILRDRGIPVYLLRKQKDIQIEALFAVLSDLSEANELNEVNYIDLTFQNQVVVGMGV